MSNPTAPIVGEGEHPKTERHSLPNGWCIEKGEEAFWFLHRPRDTNGVRGWVRFTATPSFVHQLAEGMNAPTPELAALRKAAKRLLNILGHPQLPIVPTHMADCTSIPDGSAPCTCPARSAEKVLEEALADINNLLANS